ncbi:MAG: GHKL domain-containing protein [Oscillospiraceae bacterium]|nr:GHKL domain-containing protein [Oscillospiraceae bacterium]
MFEIVTLFTNIFLALSFTAILEKNSSDYRIISKTFSKTVVVAFIFGSISLLKISEITPVFYYPLIALTLLVGALAFRFTKKKCLKSVAFLTVIYLVSNCIFITLISMITRLRVKDILKYSELNLCAVDILSAIIISATALIVIKKQSELIKNKYGNFTTLLNALGFCIIVLTGIFISKNSTNFTGIYIFYLVAYVCWFVVLWADYLNFKSKQNQLTAEIYMLINSNLQNALAENEEIRKLRHDMKHYIAGAKLLLNDSRTDALKNYLDEVDEKITICDNIKTENQSLSAILNLKNVIAKQKGIVMKVSVFSKFSQVSDTDIFILFGNLLDNAIEACEKCESGEIYVTIFEKSGFTNIEITNTTDKTDIDFSNTSKENTQNHGFGMKSVVDVVNKYDGVLTAENQNEKVSVKISIPI